MGADGGPGPAGPIGPQGPIGERYLHHILIFTPAIIYKVTFVYDQKLV